MHAGVASGKERQGGAKLHKNQGERREAKRRICESRKVVREENGKKLFSFLASPHLAKGGCMNKKLASRCYFHLEMFPCDRKSGKVRHNKPDDLDKEYFSSHNILHFFAVTLPVASVASFVQFSFLA